MLQKHSREWEISRELTIPVVERLQKRTHVCGRTGECCLRRQKTAVVSPRRLDHLAIDMFSKLTYRPLLGSSKVRHAYLGIRLSGRRAVFSKSCLVPVLCELVGW